MALTFESADETKSVTVEMVTAEFNFHLVLFVFRYFVNYKKLFCNFVFLDG